MYHANSQRSNSGGENMLDLKEKMSKKMIKIVGIWHLAPIAEALILSLVLPDVQ